MIDFACPSCGREMHVPPSAAGKTGQCKTCGASIIVPQPPMARSSSNDVSIEQPRKRRSRDLIVDDGDEESSFVQPGRRQQNNVVQVNVNQQTQYSNSLGIASVVLGILALLVCWVPLLGMLGLPLSLIGLLLGGIAVAIAIFRNGAGLGFGIAGGSVSLLAVIICFAVNYILFSGAVQQAREAAREAERRANAEKVGNANNANPIMPQIDNEPEPGLLQPPPPQSISAPEPPKVDPKLQEFKQKVAHYLEEARVGAKLLKLAPSLANATDKARHIEDLYTRLPDVLPGVDPTGKLAERLKNINGSFAFGAFLVKSALDFERLDAIDKVKKIYGVDLPKTAQTVNDYATEIESILDLQSPEAWKEVTGSDVLTVTGTTTYQTTSGGTKTIPVIEPTNPEAKAIEASKFREWIDKDGKPIANARFVEFKNNQVFLEQADSGKKIEFPHRNLSKEDQKWISDELKRQRPIDRYRDQAIAARATAERSMKAKGFSVAEIEYIAFYVNNLGKRPKIDSEVDIRQVDDMIASEEVKDWREKEKKYLKERKTKLGY